MHINVTQSTNCKYTHLSLFFYSMTVEWTCHVDSICLYHLTGFLFDLLDGNYSAINRFQRNIVQNLSLTKDAAYKNMPGLSFRCNSHVWYKLNTFLVLLAQYTYTLSKFHRISYYFCSIVFMGTIFTNDITIEYNQAFCLIRLLSFWQLH